MTYQEILEKIRELLVSQLPIIPEQVRPGSKLIEDLEADSANIMILICDIENEFEIQVDNDVLSTIRTVDDVVKYIQSCL